MMDNSSKDGSQKPQKISNEENYITYALLQQIIKETNIPKKIIEEKNSELWYETLTGKGQIYFRNNVIYTGGIKNGMLESKANDDNDLCTIQFSDGTKYEGEIHENHLIGKGEFSFPSGASYKGDIKNGLRHGYGVYTSPEGVSYEGDWEKGLKHGHGKMIKPSMTYEGDWKNGAIHGKGILRWENGNVYSGGFKANLIHGDGFMIWNDLFEKYVGEWNNNLQEGHGIHMWYEPKGEIKSLRNRYIGEWINGIRNGYGVYIYSNGSWYEGMWENNCKEGFGIFTFLDGTRYIGRFEKDRLIDKDNQLTLEQIEELSKPKEDINSSQNEKNKKVDYIPSNSPNRSKRKSIKSNNPANIMEIIEETQNEILHTKSRNTMSPDQTLSNSSSNKFKKDQNISKIKDKVSSVDDKNQKVTSNSGSHNNTKNTTESKNYKYSPFLNIDDLIILKNDISNDLNNIKHTLLRSITDIRQLYYFIVKNVDKENEDLLVNYSKVNQATTINKSGQTREVNSSKQKLQIHRQSKISGIHSINPSTQAVSISETEKMNDFSFSMALKDLWRFLRESGLIGLDFCLCDFNRIYYNNPTNEINMFYVPDYIQTPEDVYDYLRDMISTSKENFYLINKKYIEYYYNLNNQPIPQTLLSQRTKKFEKDNSIHNKNNVILLRYFNEALIRIAYVKYLHLKDIPLSQKLKNLLNIIITPKNKKSKASNRSSLSKLEQSFNTAQAIQENKTKLQEKMLLDNFCLHFENRLNEIFNNLYKQTTIYPNQRDKTITYRFFYKNVIRKSKVLKKLFTTKMKFIEIINYYHKNKMVVKTNEIGLNPIRYLIYFENLLDLEFIQFEFTSIRFT